MLPHYRTPMPPLSLSDTQSFVVARLPLILMHPYAPILPSASSDINQQALLVVYIIIHLYCFWLIEVYYPSGIGGYVHNQCYWLKLGYEKHQSYDRVTSNPHPHLYMILSSQY